jgi:hypothetical protein
MPRDSYLGDDVLQEIAGRLRFGASDIEEAKRKFSKPEPKPWTYPTHPLDNIAAEYGMRGFEFKVLQEAAMEKMKEHTILQHYYKRFLMAAKLVLEDELEKSRQHERRQSEEKNKREASYQSRLREYTNKINQLEKSWSDVRNTIRTRWGRLGKSIAKLVEDNAYFESMAERDVAFLKELARLGVAKIDDERVISINWDLYQDVYIEDMNEVIHNLNNEPSGGFIKKPTVTKLGESA